MPADPAEPMAALLRWFAGARRDLPWRRDRHPYAVWVSEVMLQQTQASTVVPYFERWMLRFPDLESLAGAPLADVLKTWEGLGYYSRARHLHAAAGMVLACHAGSVPADLADLCALPGVGEYTAGAILSIAYGQPVPVLDANVRRVLCRLDDVAEDPKRAPVHRRLRDRALSLVESAPRAAAGDANEALMELGALVCTPRRPRCADCPLTGWCLARARGTQALRPAPSPRPAVPAHRELAAVIPRPGDGRYLLVRRPYSGLLAGLWGFPGLRQVEDGPPAEQLAAGLAQQLHINVAVGPVVATVKHAYTHFRVTLEARLCTLSSGDPQGDHYAESGWVTAEEAQRLPLAAIDKKVLARLTIPAGDANS